MWPSCSKKDEEGILQIIKEVNNSMMNVYNVPLMNFCTDGDGTRRIVSNKILTKNNVIQL